MLHLSNGSLEVADPCSGIRSLISISALSVLITYYSKTAMIKKIIIVFLCIPLVVFGNILRIVFFGILLETKGILIGEGLLHTITGLVIFLFALIGVLIFSKIVSER
jgi:exosortase/archaeosortase family protein